ncbi:competence type IV pilus minor pilin ComGD [Solibacillus sp. CAU 1738]|uniref:competence type IV pilus minor pilin ComGD n=1 Tax=Solibacillus sp. CAU 1738 TaxID=3140363 RepID=UPI003260661F
MKNNERGFTLIEMLLVLAIFVIMSFIVFSFSLAHLQPDPFERAVRQFELDVREMQAYAMQNRAQITCWVISEIEFQSYRYVDGHLILRRKFPPGMTVKIHTYDKRIVFKPSGSIVNFGTVEFNYKDQTVKYSINLGKGRMRLLEQ